MSELNPVRSRSLGGGDAQLSDVLRWISRLFRCSFCLSALSECMARNITAHPSVITDLKSDGGNQKNVME